MFGRAAKERMITVLGAFFDDSGTHASSHDLSQASNGRWKRQGPRK